MIQSNIHTAMNRKVIGIGETILDILFRDGQPQAAVPEDPSTTR